jgi:hypothetical protein
LGFGKETKASLSGLLYEESLSLASNDKGKIKVRNLVFTNVALQEENLGT